MSRLARAVSVLALLAVLATSCGEDEDELAPEPTPPLAAPVQRTTSARPGYMEPGRSADDARLDFMLGGGRITIVEVTFPEAGAQLFVPASGEAATAIVVTLTRLGDTYPDPSAPPWPPAPDPIVVRRFSFDERGVLVDPGRPRPGKAASVHPVGKSVATWAEAKLGIGWDAYEPWRHARIDPGVYAVTIESDVFYNLNTRIRITDGSLGVEAGLCRPLTMIRRRTLEQPPGIRNAAERFTNPWVAGINIDALEALGRAHGGIGWRQTHKGELPWHVAIDGESFTDAVAQHRREGSTYRANNLEEQLPSLPARVDHVLDLINAAVGF